MHQPSTAMAAVTEAFGSDPEARMVSMRVCCVRCPSSRRVSFVGVYSGQCCCLALGSLPFPGLDLLRAFTTSKFREKIQSSSRRSENRRSLAVMLGET